MVVSAACKSYRGKVWMKSLCPQPTAWTQQIKKLNTDLTEEHGLVFHG